MNIEINLSQQSVNNAINELKDYLARLNDKNEMFVRKLAELGIPIIDERMGQSQGDASDPYDTKITVRSDGDRAEAVLTVSGTEILFIEFGSGIYYNENSATAHASEFGYGVGTYPGQTHAFDEDGWWYRDDIGVLHHSYGQQATAPVLSASHEIISNIRKIAREVYGSQ